MIVIGTYTSRRARLARAVEAGFDPADNTAADQVTPDPLTPDWQAALDASVAEVRAIGSEVPA